MRAKGSFKFIILLLGVGAAAWGGSYLVTYFTVLRSEPAQILPGKVNLIGIRLAGEKIVVSNGIASLEQNDAANFGSEDSHTDGSDMSTGATGSKVPIKALILAMQGEKEGVSELVCAFNKTDYNDLPPESVTWTMADVEAAISNDQAKRKQLESDLNTRLDGSPTDQIVKSSMRTGIYVRVPVFVEVPSGKETKPAEGEIVVPFTTDLVRRTMNHRLIRDKIDADNATFLAVYNEVWGGIRESGAQEDVVARLRSLYSPARREQWVAPVDRLLRRVWVILAENQVTGASLESLPRSNGEGESFSVNLELTTEGRNRLWNYTHNYPGCQLLFVVDGVAIAAPFAKQEMKYSAAVITNISDEDLAKSAVDLINTSKNKTKP